ncbi:ornithine carbamoyltransferase [Chloroflexota bacterium]
MKRKDLLSISDLNSDDIHSLISAAIDSKGKGWITLLDKKIVAILFEKPSLRTRASFEVGIRQLGGEAIYLSPAEVGLGKRESVEDVARVLGRYVDTIVARTFAHESIEAFASYSGVPVINALSDYEHPCQALADFLTIYEKKGKLKGLNLAYIGDGNNIANSLVFAASLCEMNFRIASPAGYSIQENVLKRAQEYARDSGTDILCTEKPEEAVNGADIVYTDAWASMGQEAEAEERKRVFSSFQVNSKLMAQAKQDAIFMHCLPAHRGEEVTDDVMDSPQSVVFDQAENRLHAQKAVLVSLMSNSEG